MQQEKFAIGASQRRPSKRMMLRAFIASAGTRSIRLAVLLSLLLCLAAIV